jgi:hypothetical protein
MKETYKSSLGRDVVVRDIHILKNQIEPQRVCQLLSTLVNSESGSQWERRKRRRRSRRRRRRRRRRRKPHPRGYCKPSSEQARYYFVR